MASEPLLEVQLAQYLKSQGFGDLATDPGRRQRIFWGESPDTVPETITILEEGGSAPLLTLGETRSFTVRITSASYVDARTRAQQVNRALQEQQGILSTIMVARITADANPVSLGRDQSSRHVISQTFTAVVKRIEPQP